ncbi:Starch binding domain containing protein [Trichomonas vaginalis G3]|uniref:4-alpha-glucanotransferase n=1 Tax=Trichomonas vaginalis (strain ATCC PRA-98 / G3) TaxID=412133 RepID=A2FX82_TRIV3|nr:heteropolysaccharide binding [Trichomonas vaginalis G3]EAX90495.1 Starch binding domain containing protein [Trichomonas vaginalis G3]KAI5538665.1 heteropolysaccharide binding [Trichomonas vaginalis G3]|eukprot:XP_001303425.1 Starch binding domain containing protein [Trichomonas vaginalis G3]
MESAVVTLRFIFKSDYYNGPVTASVRWMNYDNNVQTPQLNYEINLKQLSNIEFINDLTITVPPNSRIYFQFVEKTPFETKFYPISSYPVKTSFQNPIEILETEPSRTPNQSRTVLRFKMNYYTYFGQNLYIIGSTRSLGFWDPKNALPLSHSGSIGSSNIGPNGLFSDRRYNWQGDLVVDCLPPSLTYKYICYDGTSFVEEPEYRTITLGGAGGIIELNDVWRLKTISSPLYSTTFFADTIFKPSVINDGRITTSQNENIKCFFRANVAGLGRDRKLRIVGSIPELGEWNETRGLDLASRVRPLPDNWPVTESLGWSIEVEIPASRFPFEYKYIAPSAANTGSALWEIGENHTASVSSGVKSATFDNWHINFPDLTFHGSSIFFSFKSIRCQSPVCSFNVFAQIGQWASRCGFSHIQVADIFDTRAMSGQMEKLPVSGFALNPLLLSLAEYGFVPGSDDPNVLYVEKINFLENRVFPAKISEMEANVDKFIEDNLFWLEDYAKLCESARRCGSAAKAANIQNSDPKFRKIVRFIQYLCYEQIKNAVKFCRELHIAVGLDLPFALSEFSAEARYRQYLFLRDCKLGTPPSQNSPVGSVLPAFPYNFKNVGCHDWITNRLDFFGRLFPAIRLESTVNFFRQWIIPTDRCVRAVFGRYEPSVSISCAELETWGLWDVERYSKAYIHSDVLENLFGDDARAIEENFLYRLPDGSLAFKQEFSSERLLVDSQINGYALELRNRHLKNLLRLQGEVLLIRIGDGDFMPRPALNIAPDEKGGASISFSALPPYEQNALLRLLNESTQNKQRPLWASSGRSILSRMMSQQHCLVFSDAAGVHGEICDDVIQKLNIVPLRVQTEGKCGNTFDDVRSYPFFSVAAPARNSDPPLSQMWDNGRIECRRLWEEELWESGQAPVSFGPNVASTIMRQHCWSASMLTMFPIDCLPGSTVHIVRSKLSEYGALDVAAFVNDQKAEKDIKEILEQTKRIN